MVFLDVGSLIDDPDEVRRSFHHEVFHLIDYRDDGVVTRDPAWEALNPPGFKYAGGGRAALADPAMTTDPTDKVPGFVTGYSTSAVEEDKAELFAFLVVHPAYMAKRAATDPVIRAKVARMKALLAAFCPAVDEAYWARLARVRGDNDPIPAGPAAGPRPN